MLIMILQKMFEICRLGDYCVIDTLQTKQSAVLQNMDFALNLLHVCSVL